MKQLSVILISMFVLMFSCGNNDEKKGNVNLEKFTFLQTKTYSCNGKSYTVKEYKHIKTGMEFVEIPTGSFMMGAKSSESTRPVHKVKISRFLMSKTEVTQGVWEDITGEAPWKEKGVKVGRNYPATFISWNDCKNFSDKVGLSLPTEAQWEYACRSGSKKKYYWDNEPKLFYSEESFEHAWYIENSGRVSHEVGQKKTNAFGLHDMSGNVWEWCADWYDYHAYSRSAKVNPRGADEGFLRVIRGGGCADRSLECYFRKKIEPKWFGGDLGLRLCVNIENEEKLITPKKEKVALSPKKEKFILKKINLKSKGFELLGTKSYSCNGITYNVKEYMHKKTGIEFVFIPGGSFMMGSDDPDVEPSNGPVHKVTLDSFLMAKYEISQGIWEDTKFTSPWKKEDIKKGRNYPAVCINWNEANKFCIQEGFALPTEAQWEYASRSGSSSTYYWGDNIDSNYVWTEEDNLREIGKKKPNAFGLFDMIGNITEWCADNYDSHYYITTPTHNPTGAVSGSTKVLRGGHFNSGELGFRNASRDNYNPVSRFKRGGFRPIFSLINSSSKDNTIDTNKTRFWMQKNTVIKDNTTGLEWYVGDGEFTWSDAKTWIKKLNDVNFADTQWRLPTLEELQKLHTQWLPTLEEFQEFPTKHNSNLNSLFVNDDDKMEVWASEAGSKSRKGILKRYPYFDFHSGKKDDTFLDQMGYSVFVVRVSDTANKMPLDKQNSGVKDTQTNFKWSALFITILLVFLVVFFTMQNARKKK